MAAHVTKRHQVVSTWRLVGRHAAGIAIMLSVVRPAQCP